MTDITRQPESFEARYQVNDGYVGGARPQGFKIKPGDIEDDMSDEDLEILYEDMCADHMQEHITVDVERVDEFKEWARKVPKERASE